MWHHWIRPRSTSIISPTSTDQQASFLPNCILRSSQQIFSFRSIANPPKTALASPSSYPILPYHLSQSAYFVVPISGQVMARPGKIWEIQKHFSLRLGWRRKKKTRRNVLDQGWKRRQVKVAKSGWQWVGALVWLTRQRAIFKVGRVKLGWFLRLF